MVTVVRIPGLLFVMAAAALSVGGCAVRGERAAVSRWNETYERQVERAPTLDATTSGVPGVGVIGHELSIPDGASVSLDTLLAIAEATNPGLRAAFESWSASLERIPQASALPDPRLTYAYFVESVETRVGPQKQRFGVSQTFPLLGKLGLRGERAVHEANAGGARFEAARRDLRVRVTRLWSDYFYLERAVAVTDENVRLLQSLERVALQQYSAGRASHSAVVRAQVELGRLEDRLRGLLDQRRPTLAALGAELGDLGPLSVTAPDSLETRGLAYSLDALRELALANNPQLVGHRAGVSRDEAGLALASKSPIPDLTLGAEVIDTGDARTMNVPESGKNPIIAMATINLPLWFGKYRAEKAEAKAKLAATRSELAQLENRVIADLERLHFELRDADRRVDLYAHTLLPRARQGLAVTTDGYATGVVDFLDLIDSQRTLLEFELAHARAIADRTTKLSQLEQVVGIDLASEGTE